jgi:hypothetical protein
MRYNNIDKGAATALASALLKLPWKKDPRIL